jgi:hypothetical protein
MASNYDVHAPPYIKFIYDIQLMTFNEVDTKIY